MPIRMPGMRSLKQWDVILGPLLLDYDFAHALRCSELMRVHFAELVWIRFLWVLPTGRFAVSVQF